VSALSFLIFLISILGIWFFHRLYERDGDTRALFWCGFVVCSVFDQTFAIFTHLVLAGSV